jgi:hypothetical protein
MYVITNKEDNVYLMSGEKLDHMSNGYPRLVNENVAFPTEMVNVYENVTIPTDVVPCKYLYTAKNGFTTNPNYVEPNKYGIPDTQLKEIQADYTESLITEGVIGA